MCIMPLHNNRWLDSTMLESGKEEILPAEAQDMKDKNLI